NAPVELQELYYPVMIEQHRLREASGGAGKFRGGLGIEITVRMLCDAFVNINVERTLTPPRGLFGGRCGEPANAAGKEDPADSGRHNFLRMNYVAYLTDFISVGPETMLMLPLDHEPTLFLSPTWDIARAREESRVQNVQPVDGLWKLLRGNIGKAGLIGREAM